MDEFKAPFKGTIPGLLAEQAAARPDHVYMHFDEGPVTYRDADETSDVVAAALIGLGLTPGRAVGVFMDNSAEMLHAWFGTVKAGGIYAPINTAYRGEFLRHQLAVAETPVVIVDEELLEEVVKVADELPELRHVVVRPRGGQGTVTVDDLGPVKVHAFDALLAAVPLAELPLPAWNEPAGIIFTAGTTGPSKGVLMSHNYMVSSAKQMYELRGGSADDITYGALPLFHLAAVSLICLGPLTAGATGVLDKWFSASAFWDRVRESGATQAIALGSMAVMLWNQEPSDRDRDHNVDIMLAVPMPPALHRPYEERFGVRVLQIYAQSEAYPATVASHDDLAPPGYSGKPNPLLEVKLFDANDEEVPTGDVGEIVVRPKSPHVMFEGYFNNQAASAQQWSNLWHHTGDLGRFNEEGHLAFVDRKKDYLRRRGENISSFEVEQALSKHPAVSEAAVVSVPSDVAEDDVKACLVLVPGAEFEPKSILDYCVENMPYFAVPRYLEVFDQLPKNPVGRVEKYKLRDAGVSDNTWDRESVGYTVKRRRP